MLGGLLRFTFLLDLLISVASVVDPLWAARWALVEILAEESSEGGIGEIWRYCSACGVGLNIKGVLDSGGLRS